MCTKYLSILFGVILGAILFPYTATAQSQVLLNHFETTSEGADVLLSWEVQDESTVKEFRLFRRVNDEQTAAHVATIPLNGTRNYTHLDDDIFKTESRVIHYELQVVTQTQILRFTRSLSHNPTSIQRTWGSIKSMFRF